MDVRNNGRAFMVESLALASKHWGAAMSDPNPIGALPTYFIPAGAAPFNDLDRHMSARATTVQLISSLPSVAQALGVGGGATPLGMEKGAAPHTPVGLKVAEVGEEAVTEVKPGRTAQRRKRIREESKALRPSTIAGGILTLGDGRKASIAALAQAAGVAEDALCWPTVCAKGDPRLRMKACPCPTLPGHKSPLDRMHVRPEGFGAKLASIFGRQPQA